jgi:hypothetical protein
MKCGSYTLALVGSRQVKRNEERVKTHGEETVLEGKANYSRPEYVDTHSCWATMLIHGSDFSIDDLPAVDQANPASGNTRQQAVCYPVKIVNRNTYKGRSEYIGRTMPGLVGSPLANQYKVRLTAPTQGKTR